MVWCSFQWCAVVNSSTCSVPERRIMTPFHSGMLRLAKFVNYPWSIMYFERRTLFALASVGLGLAVYAYANPGVAVCAIAGGEQQYSAVFDQLLSESRIRITNTFGTPGAKPVVVFFNDKNAVWPLKLNEYGSTQFIGSRVCILIGPKGQNIDVVAHELMHAEIAAQVGYWNRLVQLPVWFDEGLAMQVDFRKKYFLRDGAGAGTRYVKTRWSVREFFVPDKDLLIKNYASAKAEVASWVAGVGSKSVYSQLERVRAGESFDAVFHGK
jgi:hypothetical protein